MDHLMYFIATLLSLALIRSMIYNSRQLETIGYALSILFLQQLIYIISRVMRMSLPDAGARGVYVDQVLLLPRATQTEANLWLSQAFCHAHSLCNLHLYHSLHISTLEVPVLEEKKRAPTHHPRDLKVHIKSIHSALDAAQSQVMTQAKILFSSPRFASQDLVVLVASSGEYYRLAVLSHSHRVLLRIPSAFEVHALMHNQEEDLNKFDVVNDIRSQLVLSPRTPTEREQQRLLSQQQAEKEKKVKHNDARDACALARSKRRVALSTEEGLVRKLSQMVIDTGDPEPSYSDDWIETYHEIGSSTLPRFSDI